jgi:hypothetical protein
MRAALVALVFPVIALAERINHEGRILGAAPVVSTSTLFNTTEADAILAGMQIMPVDNAWNEDVSQLPVAANSDAMIAQIKTDLAAKGSGRQNLRLFTEMNFALVPDAQPTQSIKFFGWPGESDLDGGVSPNGLYPIPPDLPVETWPVGTGSLTLSQWQQDVNNTGGDRHTIIVKPGAGFIWETWSTKLVNGTSWQASNGAKFNLNSNAQRPAGWTSGDAAGLPMFPALVRYDECQRGMVEHAMRIVVAHSRLGPVYPASHDASTPATSDPNTPAMGQRVRLKSGFVIPANYTTQEKAVLLALKKYGAIVADNGGFFSISITPDDRWGTQLDHILNSVAITNFEVVQSTGATGGPRSPGAPTSSAGVDQWIPYGTAAQLSGSVTHSSPVTIQWKLYSGPAAVNFGNASQEATTATFPVPGAYTLMLSAADGIHAVAYDAVTINVTMTPTQTRSGNDMLILFPSSSGHHYRVERSNNLVAWMTLADNLTGTGSNLTVIHAGAFSNAQQFYRVVVLD